MNTTDVAGLLGILKTLDPQGWVTVDQTTIDVWHAALQDDPPIPLPAALYAARKLCGKPGAKFPTPGDFRSIVIEHVCGLPTVDEAQRQIERSMRENYPGMPPKYTPDAVVLDAVRSIGGVHVFRVAQTEYETGALWKQFTARYDQIRRDSMEVIDVAASWNALSSGGGNKQLNEGQVA